MKKLQFYIAVVLAIGWTDAGPDDIYLENGGYKGILIAINENVPFDPNILPNLRVIFIFKGNFNVKCFFAFIIKNTILYIYHKLN